MTLKTVISAPFKSMRKEQLKKGEIIYFLTIDKRWMNSDQAGKLIRMAADDGLLSESGGLISPTYNVSEVDIPLGYKPSSEIFVKDNPAEVLIEDIAQKRGVEASEVVAEINGLIKKGFDGNLGFEAATVIIARKYNVFFEDKIPELSKSLFKNN
ncbi:MAG: DUF2240 family protein [Methanomicrobiaceae archaeon]|nr:DUF2240 family protein [Methanomicrobiaceae archaeon]